MTEPTVRRMFAWLPTPLTGGGWAWLSPVLREIDWDDYLYGYGVGERSVAYYRLRDWKRSDRRKRIVAIFLLTYCAGYLIGAFLRVILT